MSIPTSPTDFTNKGVVIFDGHCNLCNKSVDMIIRRDPRDYFLFASNQSVEGGRILRENGIDIKEGEEVNTLYFFENGRLYHRSTAALRISRKMRFPWPWVDHTTNR